MQLDQYAWKYLINVFWTTNEKVTVVKIVISILSYIQPMVKGKWKQGTVNIIEKITVSQGREALVGSLLRCESARQATKPPKPVPGVDSENVI